MQVKLNAFHNTFVMFQTQIYNRFSFQRTNFYANIKHFACVYIFYLSYNSAVLLLLVSFVFFLKQSKWFYSN